jgi:hypothetical protein
MCYPFYSLYFMGSILLLRLLNHVGLHTTTSSLPSAKRAFYLTVSSASRSRVQVPASCSLETELNPTMPLSFHLRVLLVEHLDLHGQ